MIFPGMRQTLEAPKPHRLAGSLEAGAALDVPVIMRHTGDGATTINVLVVFREVKFSFMAVVVWSLKRSARRMTA